MVAAPSTLGAYDAIAPLYAEYSQKYRAYLDAIDRLVIDRLKPGMRLLDIGSGDGRRLRKICDHHGLRDVVCVEPSAAMAALCRQATGFTVHPLSGERLGELAQAPFDAVTALWNVLGHMEDSAARLKALTAVTRLLKPGGLLMLDVNNRHNRLAYGRRTVLGRRVLDALAFDEKRGDAHFTWQIGGQSFPASGHLFTPAEIERLFARAGLKLAERRAVHYGSGALSASPFDGQLFYVLHKL